jgi:hypothetical protein
MKTNEYYKVWSWLKFISPAETVISEDHVNIYVLFINGGYNKLKAFLQDKSRIGAKIRREDVLRVAYSLTASMELIRHYDYTNSYNDVSNNVSRTLILAS